MIIGRDIMPTELNTSSISTGNTPIAQLINEWDNRNNIAYNQILLCISPELQMAIDDTEEAAEAWQILTNKFESNDLRKISIVRTKYENYHMTEGQSVSSYLTTMKEFKNQLGRMGEPIAPSTHTAMILRNLPESWRPIAQTIRMITRDPDEIEDRLEAHKADLSTIEISTQAVTAFIARPKPGTPLSPQYNNTNMNTRLTYHCNNCKKEGHSASRCYAPGGGLAGQAPWQLQQGQANNNSTITQQNQASAWMAGQPPENISMMAQITEVPNDVEPHNDTCSKVMLSTEISALSTIEDNAHMWLVDSAASSHILGNIDLFSNLHLVTPITIETANGEAFTANQ